METSVSPDAHRLPSIMSGAYTDSMLMRGPGRGALVEAVAVGPLQQRVQPVGVVVDAAVQVAQPGEPGGHRRDRELARLHVADLVPADRGGDGRVRHATHRVRAGDRVVPGALVVADEQLSRVAVLAPPGGRHQLRPAALHLPG